MTSGSTCRSAGGAGAVGRLLIALAGLFPALSGSTAHAQGGPPLITDDPGTPGDGNWEVNLAVTYERLRDERVVEAPLLDVNYGVGKRLQLKVEVPFLWQDDLEAD